MPSPKFSRNSFLLDTISLSTLKTAQSRYQGIKWGTLLVYCFGCLQVKKGPLSETSPMLNDISGIHLWSKVSPCRLHLCYRSEGMLFYPGCLEVCAVIASLHLRGIILCWEDFLVLMWLPAGHWISEDKKLRSSPIGYRTAS